MYTMSQMRNLSLRRETCRPVGRSLAQLLPFFILFEHSPPRRQEHWRETSWECRLQAVSSTSEHLTSNETLMKAPDTYVALPGGSEVPSEVV